MLRMVLVGLLIPLGIGVLSAMELRTPPRSAVAIVQPPPEPIADISDSGEALAKADRLEVSAVSTETPEQPVLIDEGIAQTENNSVGPSEPPRPIVHRRHNPKPKKVMTAARPKSKPTATVIKRSAIAQRSKTASDTEPCRLKEFGGLRKALNSTDCEI